MDTNKIVTGVSIALLTALLTFAYTQLLELSDRVLSLEKDKEHLLPQFDRRLKAIERHLGNDNL